MFEVVYCSWPSGNMQTGVSSASGVCVCVLATRLQRLCQMNVRGLVFPICFSLYYFPKNKGGKKEQNTVLKLK